jgi:hypothetical protein
MTKKRQPIALIEWEDGRKLWVNDDGCWTSNMLNFAEHVAWKYPVKHFAGDNEMLMRVVALVQDHMGGMCTPYNVKTVSKEKIGLE